VTGDSMKIIGLTGRSGSGKTTVGDFLRQLNAFVLDCDKLAHEVIEPGKPAYKEIIENFGEGILEDGYINRKLLGAIVFSDKEKLKLLSKISHYYIGLEMEAAMEQALQADYSCIVYDAPVLIESGMHKQVDSVWVVIAPEEVCISRVMKRDGIAREAAIKRLANQISREEARSCADVIIENDITSDELFRLVKSELEKVIG